MAIPSKVHDMIVYSITNKLNGKKYVGQTTKTLEHRIRQHIVTAKRGKVKRKLYNAINKYGIENFDVHIECYCKDLDELNDKESYFIEKYDCVKNGYNYGYGGDNNVMFSPIVKEHHDNIMRSKEVRQKISKTMKDRIHKYGISKETRQKISAKLKGNKHGFGKKRSQEAIDKTSAKLYKPVYCIDNQFNVVKHFNSVNDAAYWWYKYGGCSYHINHLVVRNKIKKSYVYKRFYNNLLWLYGVPCVETIETVKKYFDKEVE